MTERHQDAAAAPERELVVGSLKRRPMRLAAANIDSADARSPAATARRLGQHDVAVFDAVAPILVEEAARAGGPAGRGTGRRAVSVKAIQNADRAATSCRRDRLKMVRVGITRLSASWPANIGHRQTFSSAG